MTTPLPICDVCGKVVHDLEEQEAWCEREGICDDCWQEWKREVILMELEWERGLL